MKISKIAAALILAVLILCSCGRQIDPPKIVTEPPVTDPVPVRQPYPVSFDGESFDACPATAASLSPALTEIIYDLGVSEKLLAVSDVCDCPFGEENVERIGSPAKPDIEKIISLKPELLLTQSPIAATDRLALKNAGIRVLNLESPKSFAELCEIYIKLAMVFYGAVDSQPKAEALLSDLDSALSDAKAEGLSASFVVVEEKVGDGLMLSPADSLCSDIFSVFGDNLRGDDDGYFAGSDELFEISPELVFYSDRLDREDVEEIFPNSKLISFDFERFERPTCRIADELRKCREQL